MKRQLMAVPISLVSGIAFGQPQDVRLSWEFSVDAGNTWVPDGIALEQGSPTTVRVRTLASWQNTDQTYYFSSVLLDAFVARSAGSGSADSLTDPLFLQQGTLYPRSAAVVTQLGDIIKIDQADDLEPPGLGARWLAATQIPQLLGFDMSNPVAIMQYDYTLDGSPGVRTASAVLSESQSGTMWFFHGVSPELFPTFAAVHPGTITVVPAPATLGVVAFGILTITRRRRR